MKKIVLTGGPCSGKTTTIEEISMRGFPVLGEVAKGIVAARRDFALTSEESGIRQDMIFRRQSANEAEMEKKNYNEVFLDRGLIDGLGYSLLYSGEDSIKKYLPAVREKKYDFIFCMELLPFDSGGFRGREENDEEARRIQYAIIGLYKRLGYNSIFVPKMSIEARADLILKKVFEGRD